MYYTSSFHIIPMIFSTTKTTNKQTNGSLTHFISVTEPCATLCGPMKHTTPGLPVRHLLPEFTQTYVHQDDDAIHPFHPLSFPSPPHPNPSHHQRYL